AGPRAGRPTPVVPPRKRPARVGALPGRPLAAEPVTGLGAVERGDDRAVWSDEVDRVRRLERLPVGRERHRPPDALATREHSGDRIEAEPDERAREVLPLRM